MSMRPIGSPATQPSRGDSRERQRISTDSAKDSSPSLACWDARHRDGGIGAGGWGKIPPNFPKSLSVPSVAKVWNSE